MRAGLARLTNRPYAPFPTVYDGLFPNGTLLTAPQKGRTPMPSGITPTDAAAICDHMNGDHADAIVAYARRFADVRDAESARMTSLDQHGMDLSVTTSAGTRDVRVVFDHALRDAGDARDTLIAMARPA